MALSILPFEKPVAEILERVRALREQAKTDATALDELGRLEADVPRIAKETFAELTPIQKVQLSRHPNRPYTLDYVKHAMTDFVEVRGDRRYADDAAIVAGFATFRGRSIALVGHQKGRGTKENMKRNFGMPHPEGYRKAIRVFELAERFRLPLLTFIDTPGAYPGIGAEERGQSEAIGAALATLSKLTIPVVATIIGEGGSGGALALGVANKVLILEFGCYSVISPEGCAAILWKDGARAEEAATRLKITAPDLLGMGVVDGIVPEPPGGAHQDHERAALSVGDAIAHELDAMAGKTTLADDRYQRFRKLGPFTE